MTFEQVLPELLEGSYAYRKEWITPLKIFIENDQFYSDDNGKRKPFRLWPSDLQKDDWETCQNDKK